MYLSLALEIRLNVFIPNSVCKQVFLPTDILLPSLSRDGKGTTRVKGGVCPEKCLKIIGKNIFNFPHNHIDQSFLHLNLQPKLLKKNFKP